MRNIELTVEDASRLVHALEDTIMRWRLGNGEVRALLGCDVTSRTPMRWAGPREGDRLESTHRAMLMIEIDMMLERIFDREEDVANWLRRRDAALGGCPLYLMMRSPNDLNRVRDLLMTEVAQ